jgi:hypothetical protein
VRIIMGDDNYLTKKTIFAKIAKIQLFHIHYNITLQQRLRTSNSK